MIRGAYRTCKDDTVPGPERERFFWRRWQRACSLTSRPMVWRILMIGQLVVCCAAAAACQSSPIIGRYGAPMPEFPDQCFGGLHPGVDFAAPLGSPVLAAAEGVVVSLRETPTGGGVVLLQHPDFERYTAYVHLVWPQRRPRVGEHVRRGQEIGRIGMFRNSGHRAHVHVEVCTSACEWGHPDCYLDGTEDPLALATGCFRAGKRYSTDELVLTLPVRC